MSRRLDKMDVPGVRLFAMPKNIFYPFKMSKRLDKIYLISNNAQIQTIYQ